MGFPDTGTLDIPGRHPLVEQAAAAAHTRHDVVREELVAGARAEHARWGHVCINSWVFTPDYSHVLLVEHPKFGWTIPGGHLDPDEDPADGVRRELREETGLAADLAVPHPVDLYGGPIPAHGGEPEHMHYVLTYAFHANLTDDLDPEPGQPAQWFPLNQPLPEGRWGDNWLAHGIVDYLRHALQNA